MSDGSESVRVSRRRVLGGLAAIGAASAATGAGTVAYFTDSESSTGNTIEAGTIELSFGGSETFTFSTELAPTQDTSDSVTLVNGGSVSGSVDIDVSYSESDASGAPSPDMSATEVAQNLEVTSLTYGGNDISGQISGASLPTLDDLANNQHDGSETTQNDLINLADPGSGRDFAITLRLKNVGNDFQGDGVSVNFTFHLNQTDEQ